ncbi:hypothetical protein HOE425_340078 [Hoeflea sp. EC-HK425]|nr:hypothetical protein HOE425_340078 [Hoeflea sp. EC-HK425]
MACPVFGIILEAMPVKAGAGSPFIVWQAPLLTRLSDFADRRGRYTIAAVLSRPAP